MKKLASALLPILFLAVACGGNDATDVSVVAEAVGANCANGGVRITVDDKSYYACNGVEGPAGAEGAEGAVGPVGAEGKSPVITTEQIAAGEEENPCEGPALKVTVIPADETEAVVEYVCQAFEPVIEDVLGPLIQLLSGSPVELVEINCTCNSDDLNDYDSIEECIEDNTPNEYEVRFRTDCFNEAYAKYDRPAPQEFLDGLSCISEHYTTLIACLEDISLQECSEDTQAELEVCLNSHQDVLTTCLDGMESEELNDWSQGFQLHVNQLQCNF